MRILLIVREVVFMPSDVAYIDEETFTYEDWFDMVLDINEEIEELFGSDDDDDWYGEVFY